jgi:hypothetical protein
LNPFARGWKLLPVNRTPLLSAFLCVCAAGVGAEEKPLARSFQAGATESYRVELTLRNEVHGVSTETIGEKTYVKPFTHAAEATLEWTATRRIGAVGVDGSAEIQESLDRVVARCTGEPAAEHADPELQKSLEEICRKWNESRTFQYHEGKSGLIRDLPEQEVPKLGEEAPLLLTMWLRRAVRPSVIFPVLPFHVGARSQKATRPAWNALEGVGSETTEWLESAGEAPDPTLHVVQEMSWLSPVNTAALAQPGGEPEAKKSFFADSLATVSLLDGGLLMATRSATRETKRTLAPVEGLPEAPQFNAKLTATVTIRRLP